MSSGSSVSDGDMTGKTAEEVKAYASQVIIEMNEDLEAVQEQGTLATPTLILHSY